MAVADTVESPADVCHRFASAISRGRLDAAVRCLTRDACLVTPDGTAMHGREAIAGVLAQLIDARAEVAVEVTAVLRAGDVALAHERWQIRSGGSEGEFVRSTRPTLVLRQVESRWKLAVAAPWGWGG
jgi:ketosteroid isomerase-like protein